MTGNTAANGGKFEYAKVTSVAGSNITVNGINRTYSPATEKVQLVWVPYDPVGITVIANILAKDWDGTTGGGDRCRADRGVDRLRTDPTGLGGPPR